MLTFPATITHCAAVFDDVIAITLLSELRALKDPSVMSFLLPVISAVASLVVGGVLALFVVPRILAYVMPRVPEPKRGNFVLSACFVCGCSHV